MEGEDFISVHTLAELPQFFDKRAAFDHVVREGNLIVYFGDYLATSTLQDAHSRVRLLGRSVFNKCKPHVLILGKHQLIRPVAQLRVNNLLREKVIGRRGHSPHHGLMSLLSK